MSSEVDTALLNRNAELVISKVGVSLEKANLIEAETRSQSASNLWFLERSKRITSSIFGRIINRRKNKFPKSILEAIQKSQSAK